MTEMSDWEIITLRMLTARISIGNIKMMENPRNQPVNDTSFTIHEVVLCAYVYTKYSVKRHMSTDSAPEYK